MRRKRQSGTRPSPSKSAIAATTSALLSAVSLLGVSLGVSVSAGSGPAFAAHLKEGTITHRKAGKGQQEFLQSNQQKLQSNQHKLQSAPGNTKR
jgi:hypothetical protein